MTKTGDGHTPASSDGPSWDEEKTDILERSEWLSKKMISEYKLAGGQSDAYDQLFCDCCEALNRRMIKTPDHNIPTFANGVIFIPDMVPALICLNNFSKLYDDRYASTVEHWKDCIKHYWIHWDTGLIFSSNKAGRSCLPRGSFSGLTCSYLSLLDEDLAREQYEALKRYLLITLFRSLASILIRVR